MKTHLPLEDLAAELQRQLDTKRDYVADTRRVSLATIDVDEGVGPIMLAIDGSGDDGETLAFLVNDHCHSQLAAKLGIPKPYYDRMRGEAPALLARNANHWLSSKPEKRMIRTLDGNARAYLSDRYRRIDNYDVAEVVLPILASMPDVRFESCALTETRMYLKAVIPGVRAAIRVGDEVCSGVVVSNSEVGSGALTVETLVYRLVCDNGAIVGRSLSKYHVGRRIEDEGLFRQETIAADDKAFVMMAQDLVRAACDRTTFEKIVGEIRDRAEYRVDGDPVANVERLATVERFTDEERGSILEHLVAGADLTAWGYANAVTRASQDVESYERATELERVGGSMMVAYDEADWRKIAAAV